METIIKSRTSRYAITIACILISILITRKYMPYDSDIVNSQIFWPDFLRSGMSVFKDWIPTVDSWYLTVYPVHFLFYYLFDSTDVSVVIVATALFLIAIALSSYGISRIATGNEISSLSILIALLCPAFSYTYGFLVHPFSHNSTNAFGMFCVLLSLLAIKNNKVYFSIISGFLSVLAGVSDPWFYASYLLPLIIGTAFISYKDKRNVKHLIVYLISFIAAYSGIIQSFLGIPIHKFSLVPLTVMLENGVQMVFLTGRMLNVLIIQHDLAYAISFCLFFVLTCISIYNLYRSGGVNTYLSLVLFLSLAGIISSFILSYPDVSILSARFFVNIQYIAILLALISAIRLKSIVYSTIIALYCVSSIYSYAATPNGLHQKQDETVDFVRFLHKNNLSFGYGSFWRLTHTVTWFSNGKIHVTPVYFSEKDGSIDLKRARAQTMRSWLSKSYIDNSPDRQFIAISPSIGGKCRNNLDFCVNGTINKIGKPDETLHYGDVTLLVYNKRIM
ncbi:glycosyltransferase [Cronobacter sakazakii]|nr:glycosyltransferase [Cronobacter sakazakii]